MSIFDLFKQIEKNNNKEPLGTPEYIIAGLGNPGSQYESTRHNVGWLTVDKIIEKYGPTKQQIKFKSYVWTVSIGGKTCLVMKPTTFMNNSGEAIVEAMNYYKVPISNVIVICDDISLDVARLRIRKKGSDGGHNGLKNIIYLSGSDEFPRIKIGVGKKPHPDYDLKDWVLGHFTKEEYEKMDSSFSDCVEAISLIVNGEVDKAMNIYNQKKDG